MKNSPRWDSHPRYVQYHGQTIEVFTRGALAQALNRDIGTIRSWVLKGVLCHPRLRDGRKHWLYTRDQIADLVVLAVEEGVIDPRFRNPFSDRFVREANAILNREP